MGDSVNGQNSHLARMPVILGNKAGTDFVTNHLPNMVVLIAMVT